MVYTPIKTIWDSEKAWKEWVLSWADSSLVMGQRLAEWCGHGPILEQDIAMTNIALDYVGEARNVYQLAAKLIGEDATEDQLAYFRNERAYRNVLLAELPNGDFGQTILKVFFYEAFHLEWLNLLAKYSTDDDVRAIAEKSRKEAQYHLTWSAEWVIRLGDGTEESHQRMSKALSYVWPYTAELFTPSEIETQLIAEGVLPSLEPIAQLWWAKVNDVLTEAQLQHPELPYMQFGGKMQIHTEHLGYLLAEMQVIQRALPGLKW